VENDNKTNDNEDNEVVTHRTHMEVDSMVVITTKKSDDSTVQSGHYNDELVTISIHIAKNMRDGWIWLQLYKDELRKEHYI
jgi:hypothetical protein